MLSLIKVALEKNKELKKNNSLICVINKYYISSLVA